MAKYTSRQLVMAARVTLEKINSGDRRARELVAWVAFKSRVPYDMAIATLRRYSAGEFYQDEIHSK